MERKKTYPDLRYLFIRGLIDLEMHQRNSHYLKSAAEWTSKAIVSLDLSEEPVKSLKQASQLDGIGKEICNKLRDIQAGILYSKEPPVPGKFVSSAPAILVTLLKTKHQMIANEHIPPEKCYIPEETIKALAPTMCEESFQNIHADGEAFCPAIWRLNVMCTKGYIKKRTLNKKPVYELLPMGERIANRLEGKQFQTSPVKNKREVGHVSSTSKNESTVNKSKQLLEDALYTNDDGTDGLILLVDIQEWGGDRVGLGELVRLIERYSIRYKTRKLLCGDYSWIWRCGEDEITLPLLIERKRADDLARSLRDGRYINQKEKMLKWKTKFDDYGITSSLKYLIEGKPEQYAVKCMDGCGAVVKCGFPTVKQLKGKISEIDDDPNFELVETEDIAATVQYLDSVNIELKRRLNKGDFDELLFKQMKFNNHNGKATELPKHSEVKKATPKGNVPDLPSMNMDTDIIVLDDSQSQEGSYESELQTSIKTQPQYSLNPMKRPAKEMYHSTEILTKRLNVDEDNKSYQISEGSEETESQEMLDVPLGQYHCSNESTPKSSPKVTKSAVATVSSPTTKGELPYVRARININKNNRLDRFTQKRNQKLVDRGENPSDKDKIIATKQNVLNKPKRKDRFNVSDENFKIHSKHRVHETSPEIIEIDSRASTSTNPTEPSYNNVTKSSSQFLIAAKTKSDGSIVNSDKNMCNYREGKQWSRGKVNQERSKSRKMSANVDSSLFISGSESDSANDIIQVSDLSDDDYNILCNRTSKNSKSLAKISNQITGHVNNKTDNGSSIERVPSLNLTPSASFTKTGCDETISSSSAKIYRMKKRTKIKCMEKNNEDKDEATYFESLTKIDDKMLPDFGDDDSDDDILKTRLFGDSFGNNDESNLNKTNVKAEGYDDDKKTRSGKNDSKIKNLTMSKRYKRQIEDILNIVPDVDVYRVQTLLELYGGNADMVVSALFEDGSQNN